MLSTNPLSIKSDRRWIKWPAATMILLWKQFDDDVDQILEAMAKGGANRKLHAMTTIIVSIPAERFGEEEKKSSGTSYSKYQRALKIHNIRMLMCILRKKIRVLHRASEAAAREGTEISSLYRQPLLVH